MNKLIVIGDSFTWGDECKSDCGYEYESKYPMGDENMWPNLLSSNLNLPLINYSKPGGSNQMVLRYLTQSMESLNQGDFVIVGLTSPDRFELPYKNEMLRLIPNKHMFKKELMDSDYLFYNTVSEYVKYVHTPHFEKLNKEVLKSINSIKTYLTKSGVNIFTWTWSKDFDCDYNIELLEFEKIYEHTNGEIDNHHFSWKGQRQFFEHMKKILDERF
jgi:lysophospholipase L1-like esterase